MNGPLRPWLAFTDLRSGDRFRFEKHTEVYTKWRGGWFRDEAGRRFRTGKWTAVEVVSWAMTPPERDREDTQPVGLAPSETSAA